MRMLTPTEDLSGDDTDSDSDSDMVLPIDEDQASADSASGIPSEVCNGLFS